MEKWTSYLVHPCDAEPSLSFECGEEKVEVIHARVCPLSGIGQPPQQTRMGLTDGWKESALFCCMLVQQS